MEEIIAKRMQNSNTSKIPSLTSEYENYTLTLRKMRLQSQLLKRRLTPITLHYGISLDDLELSYDLKSKDNINRIITSSSYDEVFYYINEIYNTSNYNSNHFKFGLYLLKHKLSDDTIKDKDIPSLIQKGFFDVTRRIIQYTQTQINSSSPSTDTEDLIYDLYWIFINFSYYSTEEENEPLISEEYMNYHYSLLKFESNDTIIASILELLGNFACQSYHCSSIIIEYQNENLLELIFQYITSGINNNKYLIVTSAYDILHSYVNTIKADYIKEINESVIRKILSQSITLINLKATYRQCLWTMSIISSLSPIIFKEVLEYSEVFTSMMSFNYSDTINNANNSECLIPFSKIISNIFQNNKDDLSKYYNKLYMILDSDVLSFIEKILHEYKNSKVMKKKMIKAIGSICNSDKRFIDYLVKHNTSLVCLLIEMLSDSNYKIKDKTIDIFHSMTCIISFSITLCLISNGLIKKILDLITPNITSHIPCDILLKCLQIIHNILLVGDLIKTINNINSIADKFEKMGGREILEKHLEHVNKEVYMTSQLILDSFFSN